MPGQIRRFGLFTDQLRPLPDPNPGILRGATRPDPNLQARALLGPSGSGRYSPWDRPQQDPQPRVGEGENLRQGSGRHLPTNDQTVQFSSRSERGDKRQSQRKVRMTFEWNNQRDQTWLFNTPSSMFVSFPNRKTIQG